MARLITAGAATPPGAVEAFAMATPPRGWLACDGAAVSRTDYPRLFAAIGTDYGPGDGSTTFNLPDLRGEFVRGWDDGRGVDSGRVLGSSQADENKSHDHSGSTNTTGNHRHRVESSNDGSSGLAGAGFNGGWGRYTDYSGSHSHSLSINASGGAESRPRNVAMRYCIKA